MPRVGFEPTISAGERPHTYALDHTATGNGKIVLDCIYCQYVYYKTKSLHHVSPTGSWDVQWLTVFKSKQITLKLF